MQKPEPKEGKAWWVPPATLHATPCCNASSAVNKVPVHKNAVYISSNCYSFITELRSDRQFRYKGVNTLLDASSSQVLLLVVNILQVPLLVVEMLSYHPIRLDQCIIDKPEADVGSQ